MSGYKIDQKVDMEGRKIYDDKLFRQAVGRTLSLPPNTRLIKNVAINPWFYRDAKERRHALQVFELDNRIDTQDSNAWPQTTTYKIKLDSDSSPLYSDEQLLALRDKWKPLLPEW